MTQKLTSPQLLLGLCFYDIMFKQFYEARKWIAFEKPGTKQTLTN